MQIHHFPDRTITINDKEHLYFGGTSYLGIATHAEFQKTLYKNIVKWGTAYGSSRNANIKLAVYGAFEQFFSKQIMAENSLTTSSGTIAGNLVIGFLSKSISSFYHHPKTHPAVLAKGSLPLFVDGKLHPNLVNNNSEEIVISLDAVLSLEVYPISLHFLDDIPIQKKVTLLIDESHSLGIIGKNGTGIFSTVKHKNIHRKIMVSSLGKALGLPCGIIAADSDFIECIKNEPVFISSSGANPAYLGTYLETQHIYKKQQEKLRSNLDYLFNTVLSDSRFKYQKNYPVIYSQEEGFYDKLFKKEIIITSFKYPTYKYPMNRIVITANHTKEDLKVLGQALTL